MRITRIEIEAAKRIVYKRVDDLVAKFEKEHPPANSLTVKEKAIILRKDKAFWEKVIKTTSEYSGTYSVNIHPLSDSPLLGSAVGLIDKVNAERAFDISRLKAERTAAGLDLLNEMILSEKTGEQIVKALKSF